jgi:hypothetical protein
MLQLDWQDWLYSLIQAFIGGGASSVTAAVTAGIIDPQKFNLTTGLKDTLYFMVVVFVLNGLINLFYFLKQSPLPPKEEVNITNVSVEVKK